MTFPDLDLWQYRLSLTPGAHSIALGNMWLEADADLPACP
jgi:hypothetical protein